MRKEMAEHILNVIRETEKCTIAVFGDFCLDKYFYIDAKRDELSVETDLVAYQVHRKKLFPGAAGTVTNNLRAMGANVLCVGLYGDDGEGYDLIRKLNEIGADTSLMVKSDQIQTSTYIKPMRKDGMTDYTEMSRFDIKNFDRTPEELERQLIENLETALQKAQGVVILEQFLERNCATVTDHIREALAKLSEKYPDKFFYADSRGFIDCYRNVIVKCNQFEVVKAIGDGEEDPNDEGTLSNCGKKLCNKNGKPVVVTMGAEGALVFEKDQEYKIEPFHVNGTIDIVGAGDATDAGTVLGLALGLSLPEAVMLGACISSITIQQIGVTGVASVEQVEKRLRDVCLPG